MTERRKDNKNRVLKEGEHQRANGTYEYKWRDKKGARHSVYAKTLSELREKELDVLRDILDGISADSNSITVNDLFAKWEQLKRGVKDNTFQNYCYMYRQFVEEDLGKIRLSDLKRSDVRAFYNSLADYRGLKIASIDNVHTVLHQVIQLGVDDNYIRFNPSDNALKELKRVKGKETEKRRALTIEQQELFESYLKKNGPQSRWWPIFTVMLWTGMRVGEVTGLRWCDVDFEKGIIIVDHTLVYYDHGQGNGCSFAVNSTKTEAGTRTVPILPIVKEALLAEERFHRELRLTCKSLIDGYTDFIFLNRFGFVQHHGTLNKALGRIVRDCNMEVLNGCCGDSEPVLLPKFSNHTLRHTFTTRMCEAGVNIKAIQEILGHADAETTLDIYADATKRFKDSEMAGFSQAYDRLTTELRPIVQAYEGV